MLQNSTVDSPYHYPPELLNLLIETIPALFRSKRDVIVFFQGAGVEPTLLADWEQKLQQDRDSVKKHEIVRSVLCRLNEKGDAMLRQRREIIKRVVEFEDFSTCWPEDRLKAQGLVAQIRNVLNVKDSFTQMKLEREKERQVRQAIYEAKICAQQAKERERQQIKNGLYSLFAETDHHKRGKALEAILNRLFQSYDILVKEAFTLRGANGEGIIEQIDGVIEIDGHIYLVEVKWWNEPIGPGEMAQHLVRVFNRTDVRGIFISASRYTDAAISQCKEALHSKVCVLCELEEVVVALERDRDLKEMFRTKVHTALIEKQPLFRCI